MIRLTLLLLAGLFATMQISGRDNGQMRAGLIEAEKEAAATVPVVETVAMENTVAPEDPVEVAFTPTPRVVAAVATETSAAPAEQLSEVRYVTGRSVNVRGGPSTNDSVVGKLARNDAVTVVWVEDNGWARIRVEGDGVDGYISADFLTNVAP